MQWSQTLIWKWCVRLALFKFPPRGNSSTTHLPSILPSLNFWFGWFLTEYIIWGYWLVCSCPLCTENKYITLKGRGAKGAPSIGRMYWGPHVSHPVALTFVVAVWHPLILLLNLPFSLSSSHSSTRKCSAGVIHHWKYTLLQTIYFMWYIKYTQLQTIYLM